MNFSLSKSRSIHLVLAICGTFLFQSNTCNDGETAGSNTVEKRSTSLLWEISGNGLENPSYLYGTIHMIDKKDFYVRPLIDSMLSRAEQVAFEIKLDDLAALMKIQTMLDLPEGKTIQGMMNEADYEKLKKYFADSLSVDLDMLNNQKPFILIQKISENYIKGERESFELYFLMQCMKKQKPIIGLETVEEQVGIFDIIPYEEQITWLTDWSDSSAKYDQVFADMITAYKMEDIQALATLMKESSPELMKYDDLFINDRNKNWIPKIEAMIKDKPTFIAVGAGHLPGESGVIELLRKKGYTVKAI
ncbi:MAG: TraB/GumN family protein [Fimbriimonadaceae bacterium]|nr:TraB/GumN family protein [Chitinophagales bacterium]